MSQAANKLADIVSDDQSRVSGRGDKLISDRKLPNYKMERQM